MTTSTSPRIRSGILSASILFLAGFGRAADPAAPLTLAECYQKALAASETLAVSAEEINRAEAQYRELRGAVLPRIGFMGTEFYQDTSGVAAPSTGGTFTAHHKPQYNFYASQPIFSGFREFAGLKASGETREARKFDRQRAANLLYEDVAEAFYNVVEWDQEGTVLSALQKASEDRLGDLRGRVRIGRSRKSELSAADSQLASIQAQVQNVQGLRLSSLEVLSFLVGQRVAAVLDDTPAPAAPADVDVFLKELPGRPDLLSQAAQLRSSTYLKSAARRGLWPTLGVGGNYYTHRVGANQPIDWDVTFTLDAPIFRGGQWKASVDDASAAERAQKALASQAMREAERDVRDLHAQLSAAVAGIAKLSEAARLAEESYKMQVNEYRLGIVNNLEVLAALTAWEQTKLDFDHKRLDAKLMELRLRVAAGDVK